MTLVSLASLLDLDLAWEENVSRDEDGSSKKGSKLGIYVSPKASGSKVEVEAWSERGCMKSIYMFG